MKPGEEFQLLCVYLAPYFSRALLLKLHLLLALSLWLCEQYTNRETVMLSLTQHPKEFYKIKFIFSCSFMFLSWECDL